MFWGKSVKAGESIELNLEEDQELRISNAAVELDESSGDEVQARLYLKVDGKDEFLLCSLGQDHSTHPLALEFNNADKITLLVKGTGIIHVTGSLDLAEDDFSEVSESGTESGMSTSPVRG